MDKIQAVTPYWARALPDLMHDLASSEQGLTNDDARRRRLQYGPNLLRPSKRSGAFMMFLNQFRQAIVLILIVATIISGLTKDWIDAAIILAIVLGSAVLSFVQEHSASRAVERLRSQVQARANILRDGQPQSLAVEEVVPGDVVLLSAGSLVPADGVLIESRDLFVNQAVLTGETFPAEKDPGQVAVGAELTQRNNCVWMGTNIRSGSARALIVETGPRTLFGQIADRLTARPAETEFERGVRLFGHLLTELMLVLVIIIFAINVFFHRPVLEALLFSVALAVGLTPQLLPAIITVTLAKGSQQMAAKGVIVRRLNAIENFGSMDVLCTDKTGTLTKGIVQLDAAMDPEGQPSDAVLRWAYLNARLQTGLANALDEAIQARAAPDMAGVTKLDEVPYDFVRKRLSVTVQDGAQRVLITKGALENILSVCSHLQAGAEGMPLDELAKAHLLEQFAIWSAQGYRVLGLATRVMQQPPPYRRDDEHDMIFAGFLLFMDPPKEGVREAIQSLAGLGVHLKIISGDNHLVLRHVAKQVGLAATSLVTGAQLDDMRDEALWRTVEQCDLFAEVDPNQKERIILALRKMGHVVGYMGDGINDAPALHAADVGISVDTAVDVAKEAADFVLLRRDLDVLRQGVEQGRRTFANTLKYVFITTSANFGNMFSMAGASLFLPFLPMLPKQILLTNFLTDFPAMVIAADSVDREWIDQPHRWNIRFIRSFMLVFGLVSSVFDYLTFGVLLWILHAQESQFQTGWYLTSTITELLILLIIRTRRPFYRSKPARILLIAVGVVAVVTVGLPFSPLRHVLGMTPLPLPILLLLALITLLYVVTSEVAKHIFYRHAHF